MKDWAEVALVVSMWYGVAWLFTEIYQPAREIMVTPRLVAVAAVLATVLSLLVLV